MKSGSFGRVIEPEDGPNGWMPLESMFAHVHTNEPWEEVELHQVPDEIREVAKVKGPIAPNHVKTATR